MYVSGGRSRIRGVGVRSGLRRAGGARADPPPPQGPVRHRWRARPGGVVPPRRSRPADDARVAALFEDGDMSDVMVAGDFVTIGLVAGASWEDKLDTVLDRVSTLFPAAERSTAGMTRDEMIGEGGRSQSEHPAELHLLDPDLPDHRARLVAAQADPVPAVRRVAVAVLAESASWDVRRQAVEAGWSDPSPVVRRTAVDAAAGTGDAGLRPFFEEALTVDRRLGAVEGGPRPRRARAGWEPGRRRRPAQRPGLPGAVRGRAGAAGRRVNCSPVRAGSQVSHLPRTLGDMIARPIEQQPVEPADQGAVPRAGPTGRGGAEPPPAAHPAGPGGRGHGAGAGPCRAARR